MPTYDLACASCNTQFERFRQGFLRDDDRVCPDCGSHEVSQRFTGFVTTRPTRESAPTTVSGFGGGGCGGGACGCGGH
jgi:putative FmdB family regulatory protein